ncbi:uncharacterized protein LOC120067436 [Benincasa hispida]|uniref:uncharacterized protein LOC120067436 n=1 Tax=Benincasa hispida TaxID=102211 RepID=UPI001900EF9E|nr:uncharacterized protein LOC120067436 [Benincasa hispida]
MLESLPKSLPLRRETDHKIELLLEVKSPAKNAYRMASPKLAELRKKLDELLDARFIRPKKAPYGAPVLFQKKKDRSLQLCIDYRLRTSSQFAISTPFLSSQTFLIGSTVPDISQNWICGRDGHIIAYETRKLNDAEQRYAASEKEILAVVHYLRAWSLYLLEAKFVVKTDNNSICHFFNQPKLSSKQARWQECLTEFDFQFEHRPGKCNQAANALSRKSEHTALCMFAHLKASTLNGTVRETVKTHLANDTSV